MKVARVYDINAPLRVETAPDPEIGPHDVLVAIKACAICSVDLDIVSGYRKVESLPHVPGHEAAGIVMETGSQVSAFRPGDRVIIDPLLSCGDCEACSDGRDNQCMRIRKVIGMYPGTPGAFAELIAMPARNLFKLPDAISLEEGTILAGTVSTSFHAVERAGLRVGETVAVFGCGALGSYIVELAAAYGAGRIIAVDVRPDKLDAARALGATDTVDAGSEDPVAAIRQMVGEGVDVSFEAVGGSPTTEQCVASLRRGGRAVLVGVELGRPLRLHWERYFHDVFQKEVTIMTSWAYQRREWPPMIALAERGKLDLRRSITATVPLERVNEALDLARQPSSYRVVLTM